MKAQLEQEQDPCTRLKVAYCCRSYKIYFVHVSNYKIENNTETI